MNGRLFRRSEETVFFFKLNKWSDNFYFSTLLIYSFYHILYSSIKLHMNYILIDYVQICDEY